MRHMDRMLNKLINTFVFGSTDRNYRNSEQFLHLIDVNCTGISRHLIHHVQCHYHGYIQFQKLHGKIKVSFNICGIDNIYDGKRLFIQYKITRYKLLAAVWTHRIDTGKIRNTGIVSFSYGTVFSVDGNTGKVSDMLIRTGQLVKKRCFSAVLIPYKCKCEDRFIGKRIFIFF